jgi:hypothetical protein
VEQALLQLLDSRNTAGWHKLGNKEKEICYLLKYYMWNVEYQWI